MHTRIFTGYQPVFESLVGSWPCLRSAGASPISHFEPGREAFWTFASSKKVITPALVKTVAVPTLLEPVPMMLRVYSRPCFWPVLFAFILGSQPTEHALAQGPPRQLPRDVGITSPIVACRMPKAGNEERRAFPDVMNFSLYVGRGTDLVLIHPNGREELLVDAGPNGAIVDPFVSYDGQSVYFSKFEDPEDFNLQRNLSMKPAHIWRYDFATGRATQLTFGQKPRFEDTSHAIDPHYAQFNVAPVELPDGRILFLSNRDGSANTTGWLTAMRFYRMDHDGTNLEPLEVTSTQGACMHPTVLRNGKIIWTHFHPAGRRDTNGNFPLFIANPDMSDIQVFAGAHHQRSAYHFATQLSTGDVVSTVYYQANNYGHGTLLRLPIDGNPNGNDFHPKAHDHAGHSIYPLNIHYRRVGEDPMTPFSFVLDLNYDQASPTLSNGEYAGKCTMPSPLPGGDVLFVWSPGPVNALQRPVSGLPSMKIVYGQGPTIQQRDDMVVIHEDPTAHYLYPRLLTPYSRIHGIDKPAIIPDTRNDGTAHAVLPAGTPFSTTGTSSVFNRESSQPISWRDDWDARILSDYSQSTAHFNVGQDSYPFDDQEIYAAQVVADMTRVDTRYRALTARYISHNKDQIWGILGEVPVRKTNNGQVVRDPQNNPDTSYEVRIPSGVPFHHRLLTRDGLMLTAENTWHSTRPGERKNNCGGCHAHSTQTSYLPFSQTAAADPSYQIQDFALQTPMLSRTGTQPTFTVRNERIRVIEFYRDIKPILDAKCASCHPADRSNPPDLESQDSVHFLAFDSRGLAGYHQATRWIRKNSAAQSLLVWKLFGRRLDGRRNSDRNDDMDYSGSPMPPVGHPQLTFDEIRTIAAWIDLGCLTDGTNGQGGVAGAFDDQAYPVLAVSKPASRHLRSPLTEIVVGVYDLHSGINPQSLVVQFDRAVGSYRAGQNLAQGRAVQDGDVVRIPLSPPIWDEVGVRLTITVQDLAGNKARRQLTFDAHDGNQTRNLIGSRDFFLNVAANISSTNTTTQSIYASGNAGTQAILQLSFPAGERFALPQSAYYATMVAPGFVNPAIEVPWAEAQYDGVTPPYLMLSPLNWVPVADSLGFSGRLDPHYRDPGFPARNELTIPLDPVLLGLPYLALQSVAVAPGRIWLSNPAVLYVRP